MDLSSTCYGPGVLRLSVSTPIDCSGWVARALTLRHQELLYKRRLSPQGTVSFATRNFSRFPNRLFLPTIIRSSLTFST